MALLHPLSFLSFPTFPPPSPSTPVAASHFLRLQWKNQNSRPRSFSGVRIPAPSVSGETRSIIRASAEADGVDGTGGEPATPAGSDAPVSIEDLPLESKERLKLEQKLRMKLAKKIRLRRKRLVRKRQLRKKGRWPPSKMKKLKNV